MPPPIKKIDPFSDDEAEDGLPIPEKKRKKSASRLVATSAVAAALAVVMMVVISYFPLLTVLPLIMISLSYNISLSRCGIVYGIITILVSVGLGFLLGGGNLPVLLLVSVLFVPYSLLCYAIKRLDYGAAGRAVIRAAIIVVFACAEFAFMLLLSGALAGLLDLEGLLSGLSVEFALAYVLGSLVFAVMMVAIDYSFLVVSKIILKKIGKEG